MVLFSQHNLSRLAIPLVGALAFGPVTSVAAYTPENHEKSITEGAQICVAKYGVELSDDVLEEMAKGVVEPDYLTFSSFQMLKQRVEPGSYGRQRNISTTRIAAQSIHGSPNPTAPMYTDATSDQEALAKATRLAESELMPDRLDVDIYAYDTNQGVRNKILLNASQFLCVSLAHKDKDQSARKFGNFMHMVGDTYSASHVQRSEPVGSECGTEKIEWHYSMDLISWKLHRPADLNAEDWRYRCLAQHSADLIHQWSQSRVAVVRVQDADDKLVAATAEVKKSLKLLCGRILRADPDVLRRPAGGANAGYSSASGTDNWEMTSDKKTDLAIQPVGLTGADEAKAFYQRVADALKEDGSDAEFSYPSRDYPDFCTNILADEPLNEPLQCTAQEIDWAMDDSDRVKSMWIPARALR